MTSHVGTLLSGRYRLDAQIGAGGMSMVYRAFDTVLERQVAIKLMHRDHTAHADQLERFRREARAVARLNHPHVVGIIDAGEDQGAPYIVFEYVEGETLKDRIRRHGRLDVGEAVAYAIEIARALGAAHERQIVHRDVKPQNVLIDEEGSAKVTDFGIARSLDQEGLTADGRVLGTTDYVSPEQALGHAVTGQSDLYSLGVVLFEMLTGSVPFTGENQVAVAMKHVREDLPDVQMRRPEVSSALASVLDKATAKDLALRYADDRELIRDLEEVLSIEAARSGHATGEATAVIRTLPSKTQRRIPMRLRHPMRLTAAVLAILAAAAGAAILLADRTERGTGAGRVTPPPNQENVSLKQSATHDFDPFGGDGEHPEQVRLVLDRDRGTTWSTERYDSFTKPGVGLYIDARPGVAARSIVVESATPGWDGAIYVARRGPPDELPASGWTKLGEISDAASRERIALDTATNRFRYYLVWITGLPPEEERVEISEIFLFR